MMKSSTFRLILVVVLTWGLVSCQPSATPAQPAAPVAPPATEAVATAAPTLAPTDTPQPSPTPTEPPPTLGVLPSGPFVCEPTEPNGDTPPGQPPLPNYLGNGSIWVTLPPHSVAYVAEKDIHSDNSLWFQTTWWHAASTPLALTGRRLDREADPMRVNSPTKPGEVGYQTMTLVFPTQGCWEVTATGDSSSLTFVIQVLPAY